MNASNPVTEKWLIDYGLIEVDYGCYIDEQKSFRFKDEINKEIYFIFHDKTYEYVLNPLRNEPNQNNYIPDKNKLGVDQYNLCIRYDTGGWHPEQEPIHNIELIRDITNTKQIQDFYYAMTGKNPIPLQEA